MSQILYESRRAEGEWPQIPGYEILGWIGRGGMGEVFLGKQLSLGRLVAIKMLSGVVGGGVGTEERTARFRREAELMARVTHPNVVSVYDFGEMDDQLYLVMEYVEGGDLRSRMRPGEPMAVGEVRSIVAPVCEALSCLHARGILHRDLKPENILMHEATNPKVVDFGIAVLTAGIGHLTSTNFWLGTPGYVAPEQQYRLMVDERADQYSLAALTYEMLTGQKPLGIVRPPSQVHSRVPAEVDAVLMRALREDPDERCPTIRDFGAAIDAALARPAPMRRRRVLALGGAGLAALAAGGAWWWWPRPFPGGEASEPAPPPAPASPQESAPPAVAASRGPRVIQNTLGMEMVLIPPGEFLMGSEDEASERPVHRVRITRPFRISQREVTVGDFRQFVKAASYRTQAERDGKGGRIYDYVGKVPIQDKAFIWRAPGYPDAPTDDYPVSQVSWEDAHAFCRWLSQVEGQPYRLPTEAEWEYACRSETTTPWSFGDDERLLKEYAWYTRTQAGESPHPWGKKAPNPHGLRDMHGNIAEWCQDWYGPYPEGLQVDPRGPETGERRVVRGGSWNSNPRQVRSSARRSELPRTTHYAIGFRVCLTVTGPDTF